MCMGEVMLKGFQCDRCSHKWLPREDEIPRVCPKCKSPYWNTPRKIHLAVKPKVTNREKHKA